MGGYCFAAFDGPEDIAAFRGRLRGGEITITRFDGDARAREMLRPFSLMNDIRVLDKGDVADEWEVIRWYERMYGPSQGS